MSQPANGAVIHDIGYQHYEGPRLGVWQAALALYAYSLRRAFGIGRPFTSKLVPFLLFAIACLPAVVSGAVTAILHLPPIPYANYVSFLQLVFVLFLADQAPLAITSDIRFRVLPLYFSRQLDRSQYVWAKLAALTTVMLLVIGTPMVIIFLSVLLALTGSVDDAVRAAGHLLAGLGGALVDAAFLAALGLAITSFTRRRAFAVLAVIGVYLVATGVGNVLEGELRGSVAAAAAGLLSPFELLSAFQSWLFHGAVGSSRNLTSFANGWLYGVTVAAVLAASIAILHWRYRSLRP